mgnify:CR=1 FL=1
MFSVAMQQKGKNMKLTRNREPAYMSADQQIVCATNEIKEAMKRWIKKQGWRFNDYVSIVKSIGLETPIKVNKIEGYTSDIMKYSFSCKTALGTDFIFTLVSANFESMPRIYVVKKNESRTYYLYPKLDKERSKPGVGIEESKITKTGKRLVSSYCKNYIKMELNLYNMYELDVNIYRPKSLIHQFDTLTMEKFNEVEDYMLSLETSLNASEVYDKLMELLGFSEENINSSEEILVIYGETPEKIINNNPQAYIRSVVIKAYGKMEEYAVFENGETFHVMRDGHCIYVADGIMLEYMKGENNYCLTLNGAEETIVDQDLKKLMDRVKNKMNEVWKYVE